MSRRLFDHFHIELSVAAGARVPRYALWLEMSDRGCEPDALARESLLAFYDTHLEDFLAARRLALAPRAARRLRRRLERFDPSHATPYEFMERISAA